ncbi:Dual specificity phosphatase, catalytic domain [Carpediemonas membranifera]|uniref:Dual specificity phosphatase, catalytic domain n=1 Tax=Carpediemonas membranifera TaxID=201153 RepID=A0A8J6ATB3_9EUKA|nr:Dual specificity phosphatase, catalytic domain [Carpediemonas membranifera]|eukprot:KAG9390960.1 Dual specificity phosphatase, catalytic domain [Carpediemonas membranifera]
MTGDTTVIKVHEVLGFLHTKWPHFVIFHMLPCCSSAPAVRAAQVRDCYMLTSLPVTVSDEPGADLWDSFVSQNLPSKDPADNHSSVISLDLSVIVRHVAHLNFLLYMDDVDMTLMTAFADALTSHGALGVAVAASPSAELYHHNPVLVFSRRDIIKQRFRRQCKRHKPDTPMVRSHVKFDPTQPSMVEDGLFIGPEDVSEEIVRELGITTIIDVRSEEERSAMPGHKGAVHMPLFDSMTQGITDTVVAVHDIIAKSSGAVLVHCVQGRSRSAAMILGHLMLAGRTLRQAWAILLQTHPITRPNIGFWSDLISMETIRAGSPTVSIAEVLGSGEGQRAGTALSGAETERMVLDLLTWNRPVPPDLLDAIESKQFPSVLGEFVRGVELRRAQGIWGPASMLQRWFN